MADRLLVALQADAPRHKIERWPDFVRELAPASDGALAGSCHRTSPTPPATNWPPGETCTKGWACLTATALTRWSPTGDGGPIMPGSASRSEHP
jgi:hypothetical protein